MADIPQAKQLLHLVFGGELQSVAGIEFKDLDKLDIVGIYPNYAGAYAAWKAKAQGTVDNAQMRYFIVHLHRLLDPDSNAPHAETNACSFGGASAGSNGQRRRSASSAAEYLRFVGMTTRLTIEPATSGTAPKRTCRSSSRSGTASICSPSTPANRRTR